MKKRTLLLPLLEHHVVEITLQVHLPKSVAVIHRRHLNLRQIAVQVQLLIQILKKNIHIAKSNQCQAL